MRNKEIVVSVEGFKSDFGPGAKGAETLDFSATSLGQSYPQRCPQSIAPMAILAQWGFWGMLPIRFRRMIHWLLKGNRRSHEDR